MAMAGTVKNKEQPIAVEDTITNIDDMLTALRKKRRTSICQDLINATFEVFAPLWEPDYSQMAENILEQAKEAIIKVRPDAFNKKPLNKMAKPIDYRKKLIITGIADIKLAREVGDTVIDCLLKLEGGKSLLDDVFQPGDITLHFGKRITESDACWDYLNRTITVNYSGDFNNLIYSLSNPPPPFLIPILDNKQYDTVRAIVFEFHNAGWIHHENHPIIDFLTLPLMFRNAKDRGLITEYLEFQAQARGNKVRIPHYEFQNQIQTFNEWYSLVTKPTMDGWFNEHRPHSKGYEEHYSMIFNIEKEIITEKICFLQKYQLAAPSKLKNSDLQSAENAVNHIKLIACNEVQKEMNVDILEGLIANLKKEQPEDTIVVQKRRAKRKL